MITYEQALKKAKTWDDGVNHCAETKDAWIFSCTQEISLGPGAPFAVLKQNAKIYPIYHYLEISKESDIQKEFDVD